MDEKESVFALITKVSPSPSSNVEADEVDGDDNKREGEEEEDEDEESEEKRLSSNERASITSLTRKEYIIIYRHRVFDDF